MSAGGAGGGVRGRKCGALCGRFGRRQGRAGGGALSRGAERAGAAGGRRGWATGRAGRCGVVSGEPAPGPARAAFVAQVFSGSFFNVQVISRKMQKMGKQWGGGSVRRIFLISSV